MAGDSCWSDASKEGRGLIFSRKAKILRLPTGAIYGGAGASDDRELVDLLTLVRTERDLPTAKELIEVEHNNCDALLVLPDASVWRVFTGEENGGIEPVQHEYAAIGSGQQIAIGAMAAGASAEQAAKIACQHNVYCRLPVYTIDLEDK